MITLVGIGHVFSIREAVKQIVYRKNPQAVCIELDKFRFDALEKGLRGSEDGPFLLKRLQKIYDKAAKSQGADVGEEMLGAVEAAKILGIPHYFIDVEATPVVGGILDGMTIGQKMKLAGSVVTASFLPKKHLEEGIKKIEDNPEEAMAQFERAFPKLKKDLVDYRDKYMADKLMDISIDHRDIIAVVGEGHIPGISRYLKDLDIEIIHLNEVMELAKKIESGEEIVKPPVSRYDAPGEGTNSNVGFSFEIVIN
ncbi:MAG: TraB/GumN family protein [Thermoplasmatota archaeon]